MAILKGVNHFSIQRIVFPAGAKMIFGHWQLSKFNTDRLPWQPAGNYFWLTFCGHGVWYDARLSPTIFFISGKLPSRKIYLNRQLKVVEIHVFPAL